MSDQRARREAVQPPLPETVPIALADAIERYARSLTVRNYSPTTVDLRRRHLADFAAWSGERGVVEPRQISREVLEDYQLWLHTATQANGTRRAVSTQAQRLTAVRMWCRFLFRAGDIASNPAVHLELPRAERPLPKPVFTADEVERVLAQPDLQTITGIRDRAIMETLFATGIRRQELAWLRIDDIDRASGTLSVHRGKGKRSRLVPISERALMWIDRYLDVRPAPRDKRDVRTLFLTRRGEMLGLVCLGARVREYVRAAGLGKEARCHTFRATTATMMLEGGADIRFVQEMLGHAKITTTQIYTRVSIGALQRVYARTHPSALGGSAEAV